MQAADVLFNGVFKLKYELLMEDYLIDQHFAGKEIKCNDEQAAKMAVEAFYDTPKSIIKERSNLVLNSRVIFV